MGGVFHRQRRSSPTAGTAVDAAKEDTTGRAQFLENEVWVHRMNEVFTHVDTDKDGYITLADWEIWVDNFRELQQLTPDDKLLGKIRESVREYCGENGIGLIDGEKVSREKFVKDLMVGFAMREGQKKTADTLLHRLNNDWFNIVDPNDVGSEVTLDGYRKIMKACNYDDQVAEVTFRFLSGKGDDEDIPGDHKLPRDDLIQMEFDFWFTPGHKESKGLYGEQYEVQ